MYNSFRMYLYLMIFIFGIDSVKKNIGPIEEKLCPNCSNSKHWMLQKSSSLISLFFIPLIPISKSYSINCPICNFSSEVKGEELQNKQNLAQLNLDALNGNLSDKEYEEKLKNSKL